MNRLSLKQTLIDQGHSPEEADKLIFDAHEELNDLIESGDDVAAMDVCYEHFGLEPDYLDDLLFA